MCIKGTGGYVVAPPSNTNDGRYAVSDARSPAKTPASLCGPTPARQTRNSSSRPSAPPRIALNNDRDTKSVVSRVSVTAKVTPDALALARVASNAHENNRALFDLARDLKRFELDHGTLSAADRLDAFNVWFAESEVRGVLRAGESHDFYRGEFLRVWSYVRFPAGTSLIDTLFDRAKENSLPPEASYFADGDARLLVALCYQLHNEASGGAWFLACRTAARLVLGSEEKRNLISRWLREMIGLGILVVTEQHTATKARRYRYIEQQPVTQGRIGR